MTIIVIPRSLHEKCLKPLSQLPRLKFNIDWLMQNWITYYLEEDKENNKTICEIICLNNIVVDVEESSEKITACIKLLFENNTDIACDEKLKGES